MFYCHVTFKLSFYVKKNPLYSPVGCGLHVESVMKDVKEEDKCKCERQRFCALL